MAQTSPTLKRHGHLWVSLLLAVAVLLISITILHYQGELRLRLQQIGDDSAMSDPAAFWSFWTEPLVSSLIWLLVGLLIILAMIGIRRGRWWPLSVIAAISLGLIVAVVQVTQPGSILAQVTATEQTVYQDAIDLFRAGDYTTSAAKFERLLTAAADESIRLEAGGWLSGVHYHQHDYEASLTNACNYARQTSSAQRYWKPNIITLHWVIYDLGKTSASLDEAIQQLDNIAACAGVAEASHFWLTISPDLYVAIKDAYYFDTTRLSPTTRAALLSLYERYPQEADADLALLALGDYDRLIQQFPESPLLDRAYYSRAVHADEDGDLDAARPAYQAFIDRFPTGLRTYTAVRRVGDIFVEQGDIPAALAHFLNTTYPNGVKVAVGAERYSEVFRPEILYLLDVKMNAADIQRFITQHPDAPAQDLLRFSLAASLLAEDRYAEAKAIFQTLAQAVPDATNLQQPSRENLDKIVRLEAAQNSSDPAETLNLALYLLQDRPIFYNELWPSRRSMLYKQGAPWSYYLQHNDHLRAIALLQQYIDQNPNAPRAEEALFALGQAYADLGGSNAFLPFAAPSGYDVKTLRQKAVESFKTLVHQYPHSKYSDTALAETGLVYIEDAPVEPEPAIKEFRALAQDYPTHRLANNALNWVAYLECELADEEQSGSTAWREKYQQAQADYQVILDKYPDGHVGRTAQRNIIAIQDALAHPEKYAYAPVCLPNVP